MSKDRSQYERSEQVLHERISELEHTCNELSQSHEPDESVSSESKDRISVRLTRLRYLEKKIEASQSFHSRLADTLRSSAEQLVNALVRIETDIETSGPVVEAIENERRQADVLAGNSKHYPS